jgi:hypothetical protein
MATKQELELRVADLENDIQVLVRALAEINLKAQDADFGPSPVLDKAPAYLLGAIQSMARFATMNTRTVLLQDMINTINSLKQPA